MLRMCYNKAHALYIFPFKTEFCYFSNLYFSDKQHYKKASYIIKTNKNNRGQST